MDEKFIDELIEKIGIYQDAINKFCKINAKHFKHHLDFIAFYESMRIVSEKNISAIKEQYQDNKVISDAMNDVQNMLRYESEFKTRNLKDTREGKYDDE